jgi:hypothetical protein
MVHSSTIAKGEQVGAKWLDLEQMVKGAKTSAIYYTAEEAYISQAWKLRDRYCE